jgi:hypothetical protein
MLGGLTKATVCSFFTSANCKLTNRRVTEIPRHVEHCLLCPARSPSAQHWSSIWGQRQGTSKLRPISSHQPYFQPRLSSSYTITTKSLTSWKNLYLYIQRKSQGIDRWPVLNQRASVWPVHVHLVPFKEKLLHLEHNQRPKTVARQEQNMCLLLAAPQGSQASAHLATVRKLAVRPSSGFILSQAV